MKSIAKIHANRKNALRSTGPLTLHGKATVAGNALKHGLLTRRMFAPGEDEEEFDRLYDGLGVALKPDGIVEQTLVERIAVTMWRQRRLLRAETAALALASRPNRIASAVSDELGLAFHAKLSEDDLSAFDRKRAKWCQAVIDEYDALETIDLEVLSREAPLIFGQLQSDAEPETIGDHLKAYKDGLSDYLSELVSWCRKQLLDAQRRPEILALADQIRARNLVLPQNTLELFARYQTTIDNQLYKALRSLREAQVWRLRLSAHSDDEAGCLSAAAV